MESIANTPPTPKMTVHQTRQHPPKKTFRLKPASSTLLQERRMPGVQWQRVHARCRLRTPSALSLQKPAAPVVISDEHVLQPVESTQVQRFPKRMCTHGRNKKHLRSMSHDALRSAMRDAHATLMPTIAISRPHDKHSAHIHPPPIQLFDPKYAGHMGGNTNFMVTTINTTKNDSCTPQIN